MSRPVELEDPAPVFVVPDLEASVAYDENTLGFELTFEYGEPRLHAALCRGRLAAGSSHRGSPLCSLPAGGSR